MHDINIVDDSFDLKHTTEYHLSIQVGLDGFSFCILDVHRNKFIVFRHLPLMIGRPQFLPKKIETIFDEEEILNATYKSISVSYSTHKATLIPKAYSEPDYAAKVATITNEISRNEDVLTNDLPGFNYQLICCYPKDLMALLNRKFTEFQFRHKSIPLLTSVLNQRDEKKHTLLINFEKKYIRMIALKGPQILLYNSFYFKNESDFLFYTLNICHNLHFSAERDEIIIGGFVADDSAYIRQLRKYISNIQFLKPLVGFNYGNIFDKVQKHQFVSLLNSHSCV